MVGAQKCWNRRVGCLCLLIQCMLVSLPLSQFRVNSHLCQVFSVGVGIHQGSVLSSLLFIIVLEALSGELRTSILWELLYADDLAVIAKLNEKLKTWKNKIESKGLQST